VSLRLPVEATYEPKGDRMTVVNRLLLVGFGVLFVCIHDDARANNTDEPFRSWVVADPLYEELLTNEPPGLRSQGSIIWGKRLEE
jgi:hypothetical protein